MKRLYYRIKIYFLMQTAKKAARYSADARDASPKKAIALQKKAVKYSMKFRQKRYFLLHGKKISRQLKKLMTHKLHKYRSLANLLEDVLCQL